MSPSQRDKRGLITRFGENRPDQTLLRAADRPLPLPTLASFGPVLKELIQNAEDAGATEMKFMYDETEHGVESLWSPDMEQHQGEAFG